MWKRAANWLQQLRISLFLFLKFVHHAQLSGGWSSRWSGPHGWSLKIWAFRGWWFCILVCMTVWQLSLIVGFVCSISFVTGSEFEDTILLLGSIFSNSNLSRLVVLHFRRRMVVWRPRHLRIARIGMRIERFVQCRPLVKVHEVLPLWCPIHDWRAAVLQFGALFCGIRWFSNTHSPI